MTFGARALAGAAALVALGIAGCGDASPEIETSPDPGTEVASDPDAEVSSDPDAEALDLAPESLTSDRVVDLPGDSQPGDDSLGAMTGGVLEADDEDCVWLIDRPVKDEPFDPKVALFWPADYSFDTSTQEILDPSGEVVASIGDQVGLGGGETPHRTSEWPERCDAPDRVWSVASIEGRG